MTATNGWLAVDEKSMVPVLREAAKNLGGTGCEVALDFTSVHRIDSSALGAIEELADLADEKSVKVVLGGVNAYVYRVLKLVKLASRFSFANCEEGRAAAEVESPHAQRASK